MERLNYSSLDQKIAIPFGWKRKFYSATNRGISENTSLTWDVSQEGKAKKVLSLCLNPYRGLDFTANLGGFQPTSEVELQQIISELSVAAVKECPTEEKPGKTGSVLLAVVFSAMVGADLDVSTVGADRSAKYSNLNAASYTRGILAVEEINESKIPIQAKLECVEILSSKGIRFNNLQLHSIGITTDILTQFSSPLDFDVVKVESTEPITQTEELTADDLATIKEVQQAVIANSKPAKGKAKVTQSVTEVA